MEKRRINKNELFFDRIAQLENGDLVLTGCSEKITKFDGTIKWF